MDTFKGLFRDGTRVKTPPSMWEFARNILLGKGFQSISNEYGFEVEATIPGELLGVISANEETVIYSIDGGFSCIGIIKSDNPSVYIPKIRSVYLGFKINRPIEGIFYYNYNKELIVVWCDGVFLDSNTPKLLNLSDIDIALTPLLEFVTPSDVELLGLFSPSQEGLLDITYGPLLTLPIDVVYITWTYIQPDGISTTGYFPVHHIAYPVYQFNDEKQRSIILTLTELDSNYTQIKIGLVVNKDNALVAYESGIFNMSGSTFTTEISSLSSYSEITVDKLVIPTIVYNRIKSMTIQDNQLVIGNIATSVNLDINKFLVNVELGLTLVTDIESNKEFTHPTLCPDEVYAIYLQPQLLSGEWTDAYPLVGPAARTPNELAVLTSTDLISLGLSDGTNGIAPSVYKRFHVENTGDFVLPPPYIPTNIVHNELNWGYWENDELYPNDIRFNGAIDYQGNPIVGGEDVRNTPIRYFRVPGIDNIVKKVPIGLGRHEYDLDPYNPPNQFNGVVPRFGVYVKNFDTAVPKELRDRLQGFRLLIVKKKEGDNVVEDISMLGRSMIHDMNTDGNVIPYNLQVEQQPTNFPGRYSSYYQFGFSRIYSSSLFQLNTTVPSKLIKANYATGLEIPFVPNATTDVGVKNNTSLGNVGNFYLIPNLQRYAYIQEISYIPENNISANTLFVENIVQLKAVNYLQTQNDGYTLATHKWNPLLVYVEPNPLNFDDVTLPYYNTGTKLYNPITESGTDVYRKLVNATILNLVKNVHLGFSPKEFISLGKVSMTDTKKVLHKNGDMFTNNLISRSVAMTRGTSILGRISYFQMHLRGNWSRLSNSRAYSSHAKQYGFQYDLVGDNSQTGLLNTFNYSPLSDNQLGFRSLNDLIVVTGFNINNKTVSYFPFRVARTQKIANENLQTDILRTFRANDYYEMPNNRGEVIAVRGSNKQLYIQQKYSLFVALLKDKLTTGESETYLGQGDLFDRNPEEIRYNTDKGYVGCTNQFASMIVPDGYVVVDQIKGNIFIIGEGFTEITKAGVTNWFEQNWNTDGYFTLDRFNNKQPVDNPFNSIGHLIGYDEKFNRLLFTKKYYKFLKEDEVGTIYSFDGEHYYIGLNESRIRLDFADTNYFENKSLTLSFSLSDKVFVCEHDYYPNAYYFNSFGLKSITNDKTLLLNNGYRSYKHNVYNQRKGTYYNGITYDSYVDLIFNSRLDLSKQYQAIEWESVVEGIDNVRKYNKTVDKIVIYTDYQCSGEVTVDQFETARNVEGVWNLNEFRDIVVNQSLPLIDRRGVIQVTNLNNNKSYFEKSIFISTFVVVRLIMSNQTNDDVYVNMVNVKSRISKR